MNSPRPQVAGASESTKPEPRVTTTCGSASKGKPYNAIHASRTYERIISRSQPGDPLAEHIIELLESMRARVPAGILDNPGSLLHIINRAQPQTSNGKSGYHWSTTARTRVRTRNVLRRLAAAQTDRRLEWVNPIAPLLNLISVAVVLTWLWLAQAEPGATVELEPDDLDDLWARWFQPFVGTSHEDGWIDRSELSDAEVHKQAGDNLSEMVTLLCWLAIRPGPDKRGRVIRWQPTLRAAIRHDLIDDSAEVAVAAATVGKDPVSPGQLADDLLEAIDFLNDDLWCSRTAETLEIDSLRIESLAPDQWIQVALHVSGIDNGLLDSRVPTLIAAIRQYRNIDAAAIYSDDHGWRLGVTTGQSAWYREATTGVVHESLVLGPGAVEGLIGSSGVLATPFGPSGRVA